MLVMSRKRKESIVIGEDIVVMVLKLDGRRVRLRIDAPPNATVRHQEVYEQVGKETATNRGKRAGGGDHER